MVEVPLHRMTLAARRPSAAAGDAVACGAEHGVGGFGVEAPALHVRPQLGRCFLG